MGYGAAIGAGIGLLASHQQAQASEKRAKAEGTKAALGPLLGTQGQSVEPVSILGGTATGAFRGAQFEQGLRGSGIIGDGGESTPPSVAPTQGAGFAGQVSNQSVGLPDTNKKLFNLSDLSDEEVEDFATFLKANEGN